VASTAVGGRLEGGGLAERCAGAFLFLACWSVFGWQFVAQNPGDLAPAKGVPMGEVYTVAPLPTLVMVNGAFALGLTVLYLLATRRRHRAPARPAA
jgi:TRAP-type C4-dicarboxylate transport system permease small subunit